MGWCRGRNEGKCGVIGGVGGSSANKFVVVRVNFE